MEWWSESRYFKQHSERDWGKIWYADVGHYRSEFDTKDENFGKVEAKNSDKFSKTRLASRDIVRKL